MATLTRSSLRLNAVRAAPARPLLSRRRTAVAPSPAVGLHNFMMVLADQGIKVIEGGASRVAGELERGVPTPSALDAAGDAVARSAPGSVDAPLGPVILGSIVVGLVATAIIPLWLKPGQEAADQIFDAKGKPRQITESKIKRALGNKKGK